MTIWITILGLVAATVVLKAAGPVLVGGRSPGPRFERVLTLMAPALLAALVATSVLADGRELGVDPAAGCGVLVGGLLLWRGRSVLVAVLVAVLVTATLRVLA